MWISSAANRYSLRQISMMLVVAGLLFRSPSTAKEIKKKADFSHGMHRVEVRSKEADSHLGHVFFRRPARQRRVALLHQFRSLAIRPIGRNG